MQSVQQNNFYWMVDVLEDLGAFAESNDLPQIASMVAAAKTTAISEIADAERVARGSMGGSEASNLLVFDPKTNVCTR